MNWACPCLRGFPLSLVFFKAINTETTCGSLVLRHTQLVELVPVDFASYLFVFICLLNMLNQSDACDLLPRAILCSSQDIVIRPLLLTKAGFGFGGGKRE